MTKSTYLTVRENSAKSTSSTETNNVKGTLGPGDKFLKWYTASKVTPVNRGRDHERQNASPLFTGHKRGCHAVRVSPLSRLFCTELFASLRD